MMHKKTFECVWNYEIGDEIWYIDYSTVRFGKIIEEYISTGSFNNLEPRYKVRYGDKQLDYNYGVDEKSIIRPQSKYFDELTKRMKEQKKLSEQLEKESDLIKTLIYKIKHGQ